MFLVPRMHDRGWRNITNIDFSEVCIERGRQLSTDKPGVQWVVMDACDLKFPDSVFDAAIDKGTLDAIVCSEGFDWLVPRMIRSLTRVLRPGGAWVCVSFTRPDLILPLIESVHWRVDVERLDSLWMYVGKMKDVSHEGDELDSA